jgi:hypothetical protein
MLEHARVPAFRTDLSDYITPIGKNIPIRAKRVYPTRETHRGADYCYCHVFGFLSCSLVEETYSKDELFPLINLSFYPAVVGWSSLKQVKLPSGAISVHLLL